MADVKERAAIVSVAVSAVLAAAKFVAALATGSLALMTDALHSIIDVGATVMTWFAVRVSAKPADDEHHYGHGKVESITALIEVGLLVAVSIYVIVEAVQRLFVGGHEVEIGWVVVALLVAAIIIDFFRARALRRVAEETSSHALESNALHFSADMWQSATVLAGFGLVKLGFAQGDALAALLVAVFIMVAAIGLGRKTVDVLMDAAPVGVSDRIRSLVEGQRGVASVDRIRVRRVGGTVFADVGVGVSRAAAPERVTELKRHLEALIESELPGTDATITATARALSDETILERVLLIAAARRLPVHHVSVQQLDDRLAVALDLEVDGRMSLEAAHQIATRLESAIRDEFGSSTEVETHIEPLDVRGVPGVDMDEGGRALIEKRIQDVARAHELIADIHDVRLRVTDTGLVVVLHCVADGRAKVADVHRAVDAFEHDVMTACPGVVRVVTHAEPKRPPA